MFSGMCTHYTNRKYPIYAFVKHSPDKQYFIDFDSRKGEFQSLYDLIAAEDYR